MSLKDQRANGYRIPIYFRKPLHPVIDMGLRHLAVVRDVTVRHGAARLQEGPLTETEPPVGQVKILVEVKDLLERPGG